MPGGSSARALLLAVVLGSGCAPGRPASPAETGAAAAAGAPADPYARFVALRGDLHLHARGSFDVQDSPPCLAMTAEEQWTAARQAGLGFAFLTEHDGDPTGKSAVHLTPDVLRDLDARARAVTRPDFMALVGYEWTSSKDTPFLPGRPVPDYDHKVVLLRPGAPLLCDTHACSTPDALSHALAAAGALMFTPHPWRWHVAGSDEIDEKDYFAYRGDGEGRNVVGAEVGPDFLPIKPTPEWSFDPQQRGRKGLTPRAETMSPWIDAWLAGKSVAAIGATDSHGTCTPAGQRSTVVLATAATPAALFEGLLARRTLAAQLRPFDVRLTVDGHVYGESARGASVARLVVRAPASEVARIEVLLGETVIWTAARPPDGAVDLPLPGRPGPLWVRVTGTEEAPGVGTPRMTITTPIVLA